MNSLGKITENKKNNFKENGQDDYKQMDLNDQGWVWLEIKVENTSCFFGSSQASLSPVPIKQQLPIWRCWKLAKTCP